jgi:hypothetical protein
MWFSGLRGAIAYALSLHLEFEEETRKVSTIHFLVPDPRNLMQNTGTPFYLYRYLTKILPVPFMYISRQQWVPVPIIK